MFVFFVCLCLNVCMHFSVCVLEHICFFGCLCLSVCMLFCLCLCVCCIFCEVRGKKKKLGIYMCIGTKRREKERVVGRFE